jgi:hypothetical protein
MAFVSVSCPFLRRTFPTYGCQVIIPAMHPISGHTGVTAVGGRSRSQPPRDSFLRLDIRTAIHFPRREAAAARQTKEQNEDKEKGEEKFHWGGAGEGDLDVQLGQQGRKARHIRHTQNVCA